MGVNNEYWMIEKSINGHAHWWVADHAESTQWDDPARWTDESSKAEHYRSKGEANYVIGGDMINCVATGHIDCVDTALSA